MRLNTNFQIAVREGDLGNQAVKFCKEHEAEAKKER